MTKIWPSVLKGNGVKIYDRTAKELKFGSLFFFFFLYLNIDGGACESQMTAQKALLSFHRVAPVIRFGSSVLAGSFTRCAKELEVK